jgi:hypothetical protein
LVLDVIQEVTAVRFGIEELLSLLLGELEVAIDVTLRKRR